MAKLYPIPSKKSKGITFDQLCGFLFQCGLSIHHHEGRAVIDYLRGGYPAWLPEAAVEHAQALDLLACQRHLETHIETRLRRLEGGDVIPNGVKYLAAKMLALVDLCDGKTGYNDPAWPLSATCCDDLGRRLTALSTKS